MLKFFDKSAISDETSQTIAQLVNDIEKSHVADDRQQLAKRLLDITIQHNPDIDAKEAQNVIMRYVTNPDLLLFVAGATTLFGNISYVNQYAESARQSATASDRALNLIHAAIFTSFTIEKMTDIGKSALASSATMSRREALEQMAGFMKNNYPLIAGGWLTFNQVASGAAFGAQAAHNESSKEAVTAGMRGMAAAASIGMTLYKYHDILKTEERTGKKLIDDRIRKAIEPIDRVLGKTIDSMGPAFPYMAAAMLTGPHVSIFYNKFTDKEHPRVSTASLLTIIGYSSFVAYLASRNDVAKTDSKLQADVEQEINHSVKMCEGFSRLVSSISERSSQEKLNSQTLESLIAEALPIGQHASAHLAKRVLRQQNHDNLYALANSIATHYAELHVAQLQHAAPEDKPFEKPTYDYLREQMTEMLMAAIEPQKAKLEQQACVALEPQITRRQMLFGG